VNSIDFKQMGLRIRNQRELLGLTREQFAEKLGVTSKFCSDIELGIKGMSIATLVKMSGVLKLTTDYILLGREDENRSYKNIINMLNSCKEDKLKYAEDILRTFIMACD